MKALLGLFFVICLVKGAERRNSRSKNAATSVNTTEFIDALTLNFFPKKPPKRTRIRLDEIGDEVQKGRLDKLGGISEFVACMCM